MGGSWLPDGTEGSPALAAGAAGIAFEPVVEVVIRSAGPGQGTGENVRRQERCPPALHLPDMGLLVVAAGVETTRVAADDHVSEGHRRGHDDPSFQKPAG